jgi:hypothetical protein
MKCSLWFMAALLLSLVFGAAHFAIQSPVDWRDMVRIAAPENNQVPAFLDDRPVCAIYQEIVPASFLSQTVLNKPLNLACAFPEKAGIHYGRVPLRKVRTCGLQKVPRMFRDHHERRMIWD